MTSSLQVLSCNVNGLQDASKCRKAISYLIHPNTGIKPHIVMLQETHSTVHNEKYWTKQFNMKVFYGHNRSVAGGLMICIDKRVAFSCLNKECHLEEDGSQYVILYCTINGDKYVLVNVYVRPGLVWIDKSAGFYSGLSTAIRKYKCPRVILAGDFNDILSSYDSSNINRKPDPVFVAFIDTMGLVDIWRDSHPGVRRYSRRDKVAKSASHLDYIFVTGLVCNYVSTSSIDLAIVSDHFPVTCLLSAERNDPGVGLWRFPTFLTKDSKFYDQLQTHVESIDKENRDSGISGEVLWDAMKLSIRTFTQQFIKKLKLNKDVKFIRSLNMQLEKDLSKFEVKSPSDPEFVRLEEEVEEGMQALIDLEEKLYTKKFKTGLARGTLWDSTAPALFRKLSNPSGAIHTMIDSHSGCVCETDSEILSIARDFYDKLYSNVQLDENVMEEFLDWSDAEKLSPESQTQLGVEISIQELEETLKGMKKKKSPGTDGLTVEFYIKFWPIVGQYVLDSFKSVKGNKFSVLQRQGVIKLLPKKGKDCRFIENNRPITLLNVDYKLFTSSLARRLSKVLPDIIHEDQVGFVKDRNIGENLLDVYTAMSVARGSGKKYAILSLDIYKAFDSVSWKFIKKTLQKVGFPEYFIDCWEATTKKKDVRILNNGHFSDTIQINRGVPQGDGLSPGIFVLVMELLARRIRKDPLIEGIQLTEIDVHKKVNMVADDTLLILNLIMHRVLEFFPSHRIPLASLLVS